MPLHKGRSWRSKTTCKMKYLWSLHRPHFRTSNSRSLGIWPKLVLRVHSPHLASNDNSAEIIRLASGILISPMEHSAVSYPQRPNKNIRLHSGPLYHDQRISPTLIHWPWATRNIYKGDSLPLSPSSLSPQPQPHPKPKILHYNHCEL